ncbi:Uncharacterised protein [Bordetella pertussis]|nr:Uncharacterised protein [Bordetella pertussis]
MVLLTGVWCARSTTRSSRSAIPCWRPMAGRFARPC